MYLLKFIYSESIFKIPLADIQWDIKNTVDNPESWQKQAIDIENQCINWQCMISNRADIK